MLLGLAENSEKGIGIGFQEMERFPKTGGAPQQLWDYSCRGACKCTGAPPSSCGTIAAEVRANAQIGTPQQLWDYSCRGVCKCTGGDPQQLWDYSCRGVCKCKS